MQDLVLTTSQQEAIEHIIDLTIEKQQKTISMSGSAGTGKTTCMASLTEALTALGLDFEVVTPTNKAAGVLQSKGVDAATLYAKFFIREEKRDQDGRKKLTFIPCYLAQTVPGGKRDGAEIIIVDEASMLGSWALGHLRKMCHTLILVGDSNQLPPVNDRDNPRGYFCTREHDAHLTEVLRNDGDILRLATAIRESKDGIRLKGISVDDFYPDEDFETLFAIERPQLICWRNVVRQSLNARARKVLGLGSNILSDYLPATRTHYLFDESNRQLAPPEPVR